MDAFEILRKQAIDRREAVINETRRKCQDIIRWINKLEQQLTPPRLTKPELKRERVCDLLCSLMPKDREFTAAELLASARKAAPMRRFSVSTIRSALRYLEDCDRVRRTRLIDAVIQWAGPDCIIATKKWVQPTTAKEAEKVLKARGPMRMVDLLVAIREGGFRTDDDPRKVRNALARALYCGHQFKREGRLWGMA